MRIDWTKLHGRWRRSRIDCGCLHAASSACYAQVAVESKPRPRLTDEAVVRFMGMRLATIDWIADLAESARKQAAVSSAFEAARSVVALTEAVESCESWTARDGHVDYLAGLFFWTMEPAEREPVEYNDEEEGCHAD